MVENLIRLDVSLGATEYRQLSAPNVNKKCRPRRAGGIGLSLAYPWLILGLSLAYPWLILGFCLILREMLA
jgi:hypothetical protein